MDKKSRELVMAKLYFKNKDFKMAEKSFNEYLSMNPEDVAALKLLAQVYEQNKRFDKAFEMYERCYLSEPERTGVLLDICRILLMNEIWLEHVDYRKWLNLAIKAFPSNPIVVNFKAFLSNLPAEGQSSPRREDLPKPTQREDPLRITHHTHSEDILNKILEKLSLMETRLEKIENKISAPPTQSLTSSSAINAPVTNSSDKGENLFAESLNKLNSPSHNISDAPVANSPIKSENIFSDSLRKLNLSSNNASDAPVANLSSGGGNLFAESLNKLNSPSRNISDAPVAKSPIKSENLFADSLKLNLPSNNASDVPVASPPSGGGNLFADSLKKLNLPSEGSWTFGNGTNSFGTSAPKVFGTSETKVFGTSDTKVFGTPDTKVFGTSDTKLFSSPVSSVFGTSAPTLFGASAPKVFGNSATNVFGNLTPNVFGNQAQTSNKDGDDEGVVPNEELPIENTCEMEPIEIKTGEEDEDILFENRCKLFRLRDKEYKERGLGSIKVLKHKTTGKGRLIMRREAIGLVCLNCWNCSKIERVRDNQVRWIGIDASDGEPEATVFLVKFKTKELTDTFMSHLSNLEYHEPSSANSSGNEYHFISPQQPKTKTTNNSDVDKPEVELVDPKLDQSLVDKARKLQLPDLFYHKLKNQDPCEGCNGCEKDD